MPDNKPRKPDLHTNDDAAIEARVRKLMDPAVPDEVPKPDKKTSLSNASDSVSTAPEITGLPVPKEPLKIKILKDEPEPPLETAPPLKSKAVEPQPQATTALQPPDPAPKTESQLEDEEEPDDPKTAAAVDDIVAHESDELLAVQDAERGKAAGPPEKPTGHRLKRFFQAWWHNPIARWGTIILVLVVAATAAVVPKSRYLVLNTAGVRGSLSVQVLDQSTFQPLKNVQVSAHGVTATTDTEGNAKLEKVKLGPTHLKIEKRAFAPITENITVGWGSNPQGQLKLKPVGVQYAFRVTDFLSGLGIEKVEAISGDASALSDKDGKILLTMEQPDEVFEVTITHKEFRAEKIKVTAASKDEVALKLAPARKHVFVSKRSGTFDVYKVDLDGKNEALVLKGSGSERDDIALVPHLSKDVVALVSTRSNQRNKDGYLLSTLTLLDLSDDSAKPLATAERVQVIGWIEDRLIYAQVVAGTSAADAKRHRLMSYDVHSNDNKELAAANAFNDVIIAGNNIYYAPSGAYQNGANVSLFKIGGDGSNRQVILNKEVWNLFRTAYDHLVLHAVNQEWYDYRLGDKLPTKLSNTPSNPRSRTYTDGTANKKSLWIDSRDGKGVLLLYEPGHEDKVIHSQSGIQEPVHWLTDQIVIYRVKTEQESADFAINLDGGGPRKIRDVTNTTGASRWYFY